MRPGGSPPDPPNGMYARNYPSGPDHVKYNKSLCDGMSDFRTLQVNVKLNN